MRKSLNFCGLAFNDLSRSELLDSSLDCFVQVATVNAEFIVTADKDERFKEILDNCCLTFDGQIPYGLAKFKYKNIHKISGSDFIYDIIDFAGHHKLKIFLLGGLPESNKKSVRKINEEYNVVTQGLSPAKHDLPFPNHIQNEIIKSIEEFRPHFLLVGFGAKKQEQWINDNRSELEQVGVKLAIGVGGTFEFFSEHIQRAPKSLQRLGLEGVYRLLKEPSFFRLKRLLLSLGVFKVLAKKGFR